MACIFLGGAVLVKAPIICQWPREGIMIGRRYDLFIRTSRLSASHLLPSGCWAAGRIGFATAADRRWAPSVGAILAPHMFHRPPGASVGSALRLIPSSHSEKSGAGPDDVAPTGKAKLPRRLALPGRLSSGRPMKGGGWDPVHNPSYRVSGTS